MTSTIKIDPLIQAEIAPLSNDELKKLESSILSDGCRDALIVWDEENILLDGHHRHEICTRLGIPFEIKRLKFASRDRALLWMHHNQGARRNLSKYQKDLAALRMVELLENIGKANMEAGGSVGGSSPAKGCSNLNNPSIDAWKEASDTYGTSKGAMSTVRTIERDAPEPIKEKARNGDISTHRAYKLTQALKDADPDIVAVVAQYNVDEPDTVEDLKRVKKSNSKPGSNGTWDEIVRTGYIQPGDEEDAVHISDSPSKIKRALGIKSGIHADLAMDEKQLANHQHINASDNNEWYTPMQYIASVHAVLGSIDIDPASNEIANKTIRAKQIYTLETNGLTHDWPGKVFVNPPYGRGDDNESNQDRWSRYLIEQYHAGITTEAILLVNAVPGNKWFSRLWEFPICFVDHRIRFYNNKIEAGQPTHSNVFVYMGPHIDRFASEFSKHGMIAVGYRSATWEALTNN